jgi:hypothetical protein
MTSKTPTTTKPVTEEKGDGILADTVWCGRQVTRLLSGVFKACHAIGSFAERSLGIVSHFADAADNGMSKLHKWASKPSTPAGP